MSDGLVTQNDYLRQISEPVTGTLLARTIKTFEVPDSGKGAASAAGREISLMDYPIISARAQRLMLWGSCVLMTCFGLSEFFLIHLLPLNPASDTAAQVASFYQANSLSIRIGAVICSWCSGFALPFFTVLAAHCIRLEKGIPIWSLLMLAGGALFTIFVVLPPICWGAAAFSPYRPAEATLMLHELANLMLVTTNQYIGFAMVPLAYLALSRRGHPLNPFPKWYGYLVIWALLIFEVGAFGFLPRTGPFAWNGLFVYWLPLAGLGSWVTATMIILLPVIKRQEKAELGSV